MAESARGVESPEVDHIHTASKELCLDFTNTVSARGSDAARDRLKTYADLAAWGEEAGALDGEAAAALLQEAAMDAASAERVLERAVALREALYRIFVAQAEGLTPSACDVDRLNAELKQAAARRRLEAGPAQYVWDWEPGGRALDQALWRVAASAADLLTSGELDRVRRCAGDECGWLFIDRSKNRSRRWCDMKECGNVAKVRRYRRRQKVEQS